MKTHIMSDDLLDSLSKPIQHMLNMASKFLESDYRYKLSELPKNLVSPPQEFQYDEEINCVYTKSAGDLKFGFVMLLKSQNLNSLYEMFGEDEECSLSILSELCNLFAGSFMSKLTEKDYRSFTLKSPMISRDYYSSIIDVVTVDFGTNVSDYSVLKINLSLNNFEIVLLLLVDDDSIL